jgi:type 1 fimbriae regulatory protein FimB
VKLKGKNQRRREYLTADEIEKLLAAARNTRNPERDFCILLLAFRHALRVSEICGLKLSDINLELAEIYVHRLKGSIASPHPMFNGESQAVRNWLARRAEMNPPESVQELFISERRQAMSRRTIWVMIREVARAAGLEHLEVHPHMLRHSTGYSLVNRGVDTRSLQAFMGLASISSTVRYTALDSRRFAKFF